MITILIIFIIIIGVIKAALSIIFGITKSLCSTIKDKPINNTKKEKFNWNYDPIREEQEKESERNSHII